MVRSATGRSVFERASNKSQGSALMRPQTALPGNQSNQSGKVQSIRAPSASHRSVQNLVNSNRDAAAS